jgi:putative membrane protein
MESNMFNTTRLAFLFVPCLLGLVACEATEHAATTVQSAAQAQTTATLSTTDATFINEAGSGGIAEVTFGQLAQTKADSDAVRQFAAKMVTDHTATNQKLLTLAESKEMTPPSSMDTTHDQLYKQLQGLSGPAFDHAYMSSQVQDHEAAVQAFQNEAANGSDADVRNLAQQTLPTLQQHLEMARSLAGQY